MIENPVIGECEWVLPPDNEVWSNPEEYKVWRVQIISKLPAHTPSEINGVVYKCDMFLCSDGIYYPADRIFHIKLDAIKYGKSIIDNRITILEYSIKLLNTIKCNLGQYDESE